MNFIYHSHPPFDIEWNELSAHLLSNPIFPFGDIFQTSASLKFTVLNPKGRIWTMVAGGGASVIYADTVSTKTLYYVYLQSNNLTAANRCLITFSTCL